MKLVVNHLTRMQKGFICVAGVDLATDQHVRPMLPSQMRKTMLARHGGPFDMARVVDLGWTKYIGTRPETEDYKFHQSEVRSLGSLSTGEFWELLQRHAKKKLGELFGPDLLPRGSSSYAVDVGKGTASLGCYLIPSRPHLFLQKPDTTKMGAKGRDRIRIQFRFGRYEFQLGVTDIRMYAEDHATPDPSIVDRVARRLDEGAEAILCVGLTRAFQSVDGEPSLHWLQVNNIHFQDAPCWQLG